MALITTNENANNSSSASSPAKFNLFPCLFGKDVRLMTFFVVVGPLLTLIYSIITQNDGFFFVSYSALGLFAGPLWLFACFRDFIK